MIYRIILDIDDVLNSLTMHILHHFNCDVGPLEYEAFPVEVGYDIIAAYEHLSCTTVDSVASFWDRVTEANLWRTAPKSPECDFILEEARRFVGEENVLLATTPTKDPQSHADKLHWIWENLPEWIHRNYAITPRKWFLGKPGVLLVDDHTENCSKFRQEGGESLLVPRPWNPRHVFNTDWYLKDYFTKLRM
jgi:5'(3')-deoxyribonucleotidase